MKQSPIEMLQQGLARRETEIMMLRRDLEAYKRSWMALRDKVWAADKEGYRLLAVLVEYAEPSFYDPGNHPLPWQLAQDALNGIGRKA